MMLITSICLLRIVSKRGKNENNNLLKEDNERDPERDIPHQSLWINKHIVTTTERWQEDKKSPSHYLTDMEIGIKKTDGDYFKEGR